MEDEKHKWLRQYAKPCLGKKVNSIEKLPNIKTIKDFLRGDYSREKVRDYFMTVHNLRALRNKNYIHMLIPYFVHSFDERGLTGIVNEPFYKELPIPLCSCFFEAEKIEQAKKEVSLKTLKEGDIMLIHSLEIVDFCTKKDLERYDKPYTENLIYAKIKNNQHGALKLNLE